MYSCSQINSKSVTGRKRPIRSRRGVAYIFALAILALMTTMTVALMASTNMNLSRNQHMKDSLSAQLSAESGLQFMLMRFTRLRMPEATNSETFTEKLTAAISDVLNNSTNLGSGVVSCSGSVISIPNITADDTSFTCTLTVLTPAADGTPQCRLTSVGSSGLATRTVNLDMQMVPVSADAFNYAIASKGSISVVGSAVISGMTTADEASVLSLSTAEIAIELGGHATIGGDLFLVNSSVDLTGKAMSVGGSDSSTINDHVHNLTEAPDFPTLNLTPFETLAAADTIRVINYDDGDDDGA